MDTVTFHPQANGCVELMAESANNVWHVRFQPNGERISLKNHLRVDVLPKTPLTRDLLTVADMFSDKILAYMVSRRNDLFWAIKDGIKAL